MDTDALSDSHHGDPVSPHAHKAALTPPTSEDMDKTDKMDREGSSSELSDLEMDNDVEGDIEPDHYYDGGKIPVFKPTMEQFRSFKDFISKIDKYGMKSGIVKVIPPQEWRDALPPLDDAVKTIKVKNPITQEFMGTHGTYTQANIEKQRSYNLPEWKALTDETQHQPPARRGERRRNQDKMIRGGGNMRTRGSARTTTDETSREGKKKPGRKPKFRLVPTTEDSTDEGNKSRGGSLAQVPPTPTSPKLKTAKVKKENRNDDTSPTKARGRQPKSQQKSVSSRRMKNQSDVANEVDEVAFKDFDYKLHHLDEYTPERCAELESNYWKSLTFAPPMYGADMPGSLFDDTTTSWNVAKLENLLDVLGTKVPGVNTAYLYLGMWKATFAWHLEDVDLYSINYIHFGAPKQWYSISQEDARRFEAAMKNVWPNDAKNCDQFLRHKTYLISPSVLQSQYNIKVNKLVHHEGEFVITFPYGYHSGYNIGYNCAESVNFATESWLDYGRIAKKCDCEEDSVWVDVADIERKLRGEPTPEYYEETDDDDDEMDEDEPTNLPSPPASIGSKSKAPSRKRKRDVKDKMDEKKKKKRIRIRVKGPSKEPCILCPNDNSSDPLLSTDNGRKAHRSCALYTPETYLSEENGVERVCNVTGIDRARLDLKCNFCRSKRGACFQCSAKKCTRAFHATCAAAAGVQIDTGMVPTFGEDGTEYFCEGYDFRCRYHRPKRAKHLDGDALESSKLIQNYAKALKPQDVVQVQYLQGDIFAGTVVENRPGEMTLLIDVLPEGDRVEVEWKWLAVMDPAASQRPKPSKNAIPMPADMNKKSVSIENRQDGYPTMEEPFHDNPANKWHEFYTIDTPPTGYKPGVIRNPEQKKTDLDKPDVEWFYLPKTSTEARAQFTHDPKVTRHNVKSNFLETVKPPAPAPSSAERRSLAASYPQGANVHALNGARATYHQQQQQPQAQANMSNGKQYEYKPKIPSYSIDQPAQPGAPMPKYSRSSSSSSFGSGPRVDPGLQQHSPQGQQQDIYKPQYQSISQQKSGLSQPLRRSSQSQAQQHSQQPSSQYPAYQSTYNYPYQQHAQQRVAPVAPMVAPVAPVAPMMGSSSTTSSRNPFGPPSPAGSDVHLTSHSQHALHAPPPLSTQAPPTDYEYLAHIQKYPYLRNSYLRKPKQYVSPYSPDGGFSLEYMPFPPTRPQSTGVPPSMSQLSDSPPTAPQAQQQYSYGASHPQQYQAQSQPQPPRPQPTYQTAQQFQQQLGHEAGRSAQTVGSAKYEHMLKQMAYSTGSDAVTPNLRGGAGGGGSGGWYSPQAPTPSPLTDPSGTRTPLRPEYSPVGEFGGGGAGAGAGAGAGGQRIGYMQPGLETWRYG
ncbi:hypothetical protein BJ546DRAFT_847043 [Cryomyces antarcticus]